jgi:hypothetical protein
MSVRPSLTELQAAVLLHIKWYFSEASFRQRIIGGHPILVCILLHVVSSDRMVEAVLAVILYKI